MVALCLPVIPVYFTASLRRFMVISLLLEQVQWHENEYVITLMNPSSFRTALIIPHPTKAWQCRFRGDTGLGCCSLALWHIQGQFLTLPGGWRTCRGSPLVLGQVIHGPKLLSQVYFVFLSYGCYAKIWAMLLGYSNAKNKSLKKTLEHTRNTPGQFNANS